MPKLKEKKEEQKKITNYEKNLKSDKIRKREVKIKVVRVAILITIIFLIIIYFILRTIYDMGDFTITLDPQSELRSGLVMYESIENKEQRQILNADELEFMDNISVNWLSPPRRSAYR